MDALDSPNNECYECNICYETPYDINESILLECCNRSKRICVSCIHCLSTPLCPYCRCELSKNCLVYMKETNNISTSEPLNSTFTWEHFLEEENIINPYIYEDSRRLRRQIRRLRYEYQQRRSERNRGEARLTRRERRNFRAQQRQQLDLYTRNMTNLYNHHNALFVMDDI